MYWSGSAKLIVNRQIGQCGADRDDFKKIYNEANDVVRADLTKKSLSEPVEQFTMAVARNGSAGGVIKLSWDTTEYSAPFTVKK